MPSTLSNNLITLYLDLPLENYQEARFDWTGKIVHVEYDGKPVAIHELPEGVSDKHGRGFYNEFGMLSPIGFDEIEEGEWFHKIGVGLLQKDGPNYDFQKAYTIRPAQFDVQQQSDRISIHCIGPVSQGYGYELVKTLRLLKEGFAIDYELRNTGEKAIITEEYCHNFIAFGNDLIGTDYHLSFPFDLKHNLFGETVNPGDVVTVGNNDFFFVGTPKAPFFFSNLSGGERVKAQWKLTHAGANIAISETGDFDTSAVNLWGWGHVISPELFVDIRLLPDEIQSWSRRYEILRLGSK